MVITDKIGYYAAIKRLNEATKAYDAGKPIMSDKDWDSLYFEIEQFEKTYHIVAPTSPTQTIHYEIVTELQKVVHNHPMLSLAKTKDLAEIKSFVDDKDYIAMLKMDGLTCSLTYEDGVLVSAETRGNGTIGEDITHNAMVVASIPKRIAFKEHLVVDGEIICTYENFAQFTQEYKNPRNFAAGSIRLLDANECNRRNLTFVVWDVVEGINEELLSDKLNKLEEYGNFIIVPYFNPTDDLERLVNALKETAEEESYPIDGIVFKYNDCKYYQSLGATEHHFRGGIAFKFYDEEYETCLKYIDWSLGRTGVLTPVAVFEPVDIDGTEVERASLHNYSIMKEIMGSCCYRGQRIKVFKSNMIIPQISYADHMNYGEVISKGGVTCDGFSGDYGLLCPVCGGETNIVKSESGTENVICTNPSCEGKLLMRLDHFCSKKGLDIKGLSENTLEKLMDWGYIKEFTDLYSLDRHAKEWKHKPGFGEKSVDSILAAIEASKHCPLPAFISALGIPEVGIKVAKVLSREFGTWELFREAVDDDKYKFYKLDGFGPEMHYAIKDFIYTCADELAAIIQPMEYKEEKVSGNANGIVFCITGKLKEYKNREALVEYIESIGGTVAASVTKRVKYLINNDVTSDSSKNKSAKKMGIPIISEVQFKELFG